MMYSAQISAAHPTCPDPAVKRSVLRYHGGKWLLAPWILSHFPQHITYVEPFGGAASVLMRKEPAPQEVYNDLDEEIVNVFRVLRDKESGMELARLLSLTPHARAEYDLSYAPATDPIEAARRTIVRSFMGHASESATGQYKSGFRFRPYKGSRGGANSAMEWARYPYSLQAFINRLRPVTLECLPASEVIEKYDTPGTLFYVDPPYVRATRTSNGKCYRHEMTDKEHTALAEQLKYIQGCAIVSGYACELYNRLYAGWQQVFRECYAGTASPRTECLWLSPAVALKSKPAVLGSLTDFV